MTTKIVVGLGRFAYVEAHLAMGGRLAEAIALERGVLARRDGRVLPPVATKLDTQIPPWCYTVSWPGSPEADEWGQVLPEAAASFERGRRTLPGSQAQTMAVMRRALRTVAWKVKRYHPPRLVIAHHVAELALAHGYAGCEPATPERLATLSQEPAQVEAQRLAAWEHAWPRREHPSFLLLATEAHVKLMARMQAVRAALLSIDPALVPASLGMPAGRPDPAMVQDLSEALDSPRARGYMQLVLAHHVLMGTYLQTEGYALEPIPLRFVPGGRDERAVAALHVLAQIHHEAEGQLARLFPREPDLALGRSGSGVLRDAMRRWLP